MVRSRVVPFDGSGSRVPLAAAVLVAVGVGFSGTSANADPPASNENVTAEAVLDIAAQTEDEITGTFRSDASSIAHSGAFDLTFTSRLETPTRVVLELQLGDHLLKADVDLEQRTALLEGSGRALSAEQLQILKDFAAEYERYLTPEHRDPLPHEDMFYRVLSIWGQYPPGRAIESYVVSAPTIQVQAPVEPAPESNAPAGLGPICGGGPEDFLECNLLLPCLYPNVVPIRALEGGCECRYYTIWHDHGNHPGLNNCCRETQGAGCDLDSDCWGKCGPGCDDFPDCRLGGYYGAGIYTYDCAEHDRCVRAHGGFDDPECWDEFDETFDDCLWGEGGGSNCNGCAPCTSCPGYDFTLSLPTTSWSTINSSLQGSGGCEMYRVNLSAGKQYTFKTGCGDGATANFDTLINVFRPSGDCPTNPTWSNDDDCESSRSRVTLTATVSGFHYVKVGGYQGASGSFTLKYREEPPPPCVPVDCNDNNACTNDVCNSGVCSNTALPSGTLCGSSNASECDAQDTCNGSGTCINRVKTAGTVCRSATGECDVAETCNGSSTACPLDVFRPSGTTCGSSNTSECDAQDTCDGFRTCVNRVKTPGTVCRSATGECDVAETCNGSSTACPVNVFRPSGTTCGSSNTSECDAQDTCDGFGTCVNRVKTAGTVCRFAMGECDVAETCNGSSAACPADVKKPNGTICNDGQQCTINDHCSDGACVGSPSPSCPCFNQPNNAPCDDGLFCNGTDTCSNGNCSQHAGDPCPGADGDGNCAETCNEGQRACNAPDPNGSLCNDGNPCTVNDACAGGTCVGSPSCPDGSCCVGTTCSVTTQQNCSSGNWVSGASCTPNRCETGCDDAGDCDDGDACTDDACVNNACQNTAVDCDDGVACTTDACDSGTCVNTDNCTPPDTCNATTGLCEAGLPCAGPGAHTVIRQPGPSDGVDVWITNFYSYGDDYGVDDEELRVGGWADYYYSLIRFDLSGLPSVASVAQILLYDAADQGASVSMYLDRIDSPWDESTGWYARPSTTLLSTISVPTRNSWYTIDITELFNAWQAGTHANWGIQLSPAAVDNNFNEFRSSDFAANVSLRPKLVVFIECALSVGDWDCDCDIDFADFKKFALCFSGSSDQPGYVAPTDDCRRVFDFNRDGDVDNHDFALFHGSMTGP